ncbi:hypothetical protein [Aquihabitans sp. G128]|uniref:hypothetical protein n=1 Tax=Aquihabitans sp. G128 TaxID=2849779 RepID=UPI0020B29891|nr:hypothetical protein [Aquihabitans sp. G128]
MSVDKEYRTAADGTYRSDPITLGQDNAPGEVSIQAYADGYWYGATTPAFVPFTEAGPNVYDLTILKACFGDGYVKVVDRATGKVVPNALVAVSSQLPYNGQQPARAQRARRHRPHRAHPARARQPPGGGPGRGGGAGGQRLLRQQHHRQHPAEELR